MGTKFSKQGPPKAKAVGGLNGYQKMLHYVTTSFFLRNLVSKSRRRMLVAGYDLDMSYITEHLLAMSYPAQRVRAMYRNPLWQVKDVLDMRHPGRYMAGKGRTGLMVCAYLVYSGMAVDEAFQLYAQRRTTNNEGVSIPSQRRYVRYWSEVLSFPKGKLLGPTFVNLPATTTRELRRIRLYDTVNINSVFFAVMEMQEIPGEVYHPSIEVAKSCCREVKQGYHRNNSPRYYLSYVDGENGVDQTEPVSPRIVMQMDTERSAIYQKTCLDYYFENPLKVTGDLRVIFYEKMIGSRLFYVCFNTAFIRGSLLQFSLRDLDKVGFKGKSICGTSFCLEIFFGPVNAVRK